MHLKRYLLFLSCLFTSLLPLAADATHIYGADFYYQHITGNTYALSLEVYADCGGASFFALPTATAQVALSDDSISGVNQDYYTLQLSGPGVEVTPVCPAQLDSTNCSNVNGTLPGVMRFIFTDTITVPYASATWRFRFTGNMGNSSAGRSNSITNLVVSASSLMNLEAELNNKTTFNNSPRFTTLPTPFYCLNIPQQYNQGAVDIDGDVLRYSLVPALEPTGQAAYMSGFSPTTPLATSSAFTFDTATGQMSFTPNSIQRSVVVNKVTEYRNGVKIGSAMREMTFIVATNCSGTPPIGYIDTAAGASSGGYLSTPSEFLVCQGNGSIAHFNIHPTDPEGDTINVTYNGLPAGATLTVANNNTTTPTATFNWNTTGVPAGNYTFYLTYKDFGCPLTHAQTVAYTVKLIKPAAVSITVTAPTQCVHKASVRYNFTGGLLPRSVVISQGSTIIKSFIDNTGIYNDSLAVGTYTFTITIPHLTCPGQYTVTIVDSGIYPFRPAVPPVFYCLNDSPIPVTAIPAPGAVLHWYSPTGSLLPSAPTPSTATAGIFYFPVSQHFNVCESLKDSVPVYVTKRPVASFTVPPIICSHDTATISFTGAVGVGPIIAYQWQWDGASYVQGTGGGPYHVRWSNAGTKTLYLQVFENQCPSNIDTERITVKPSPNAIFTVPDKACLYDTLTLQYNTGILPGQQYTWSFDSAVIVQGSGIGPYRLNWPVTGVKHLTLQVSLNGCIDTSSRDVTVYPSPNVHILNITARVCVGDKIYLVATGGVNYTWTPDNRLFYEPDGTVYTRVLEPTTYVVTAQNQYGCVSKDSIQYTQLEPCCTFSYPDAFTPNGDGRNEAFKVITYGNQLQYAFSIYDRWGTRVFYTFDPTAAWDGTFNGKLMPIGTYFYMVQAKCYTGHEEFHKGDFQLLR